MKKFDVRAAAVASGKAEYVLGVKDTGTHACYMIYGTLNPGEGGRLIKPGHGHEELVIAVKGALEVSGSVKGTLNEGEAFHIAGEAQCYLENKGGEGAVYVCAGGHAEGGH